MILEVEPRLVQEAVKKGFKRIDKYRNARTLFIKEYCGQYFSQTKGLTGDQPINLLFATIRAYVPNLVMRNPINKVTTEIIQHKQFAELLGYGLDNLHKQIKIKDVLRAWIIDALFGLGIIETGLCASDNIVQLDDVDIDPGQVFSAIVSLDNFVCDSICNSFDEAMFLGHRIRAPRRKFLEIEGLDEELIMKLPNAFSKTANDKNRVEDLSKHNINNADLKDLEDYVEIVKIWIPEANANIFLPDPNVTTFENFIGVKDYYGPKTGPYNFLALTPPVPDNPFPVAPVGVWYDLHNMANRIFKKLMEQADRQKDIALYKPNLADAVQDVIDAEDGEAVACDDPKGINVVSFGGENRDNSAMVAQLQVWYNYIAGNPDQMAGIRQESETATQAEILNANSSITLNDMHDIIYDGTADISKKQAWYLYTDPLIEIPKTKRTTGGEEIQLWLTPEQRMGDFFEYIFSVKQRSMSRLDPLMRAKRIMEFATNVVPAATMAAQACTQMGVEFNLQRFLTGVAEELDINEFMVDVFNDSEFQNRLAMIEKQGEQNPGKAQVLSMKGVTQNKGFPMTKNSSTPAQESNRFAQQTAGVAQSEKRFNLGL